MMTPSDDPKVLIQRIRQQLSSKNDNPVSGFVARCYLLYLAFLRGIPHEKIEARVSQSTYYRYHPLSGAVFATLKPRIGLIGPDFTTFARWCDGLQHRVKPVTPRVKKMRPSREPARVA